MKSAWLALSALMVAASCNDVTVSDPATAVSSARPGTSGRDKTAPSAPQNLRAIGTTSSSVSLAWDASVDNVGVSWYQVRNNFGGEILVPGTQTSAIWTGLTEGSTVTFWVYAVDAANNTSASSNFLSVKVPLPAPPNDPSDVTPPTTPAPVTADLYGDGSRELQVNWIKSTDNVTPQSIILYQVFVNGVLENSSIGVPQTSVYGVAGDNTITVVAIDANGNRSTPGVVQLHIPF